MYRVGLCFQRFGETGSPYLHDEVTGSSLVLPFLLSAQ
jgi:hypothetical protein